MRIGSRLCLLGAHIAVLISIVVGLLAPYLIGQWRIATSVGWAGGDSPRDG